MKYISILLTFTLLFFLSCKKNNENGPTAPAIEIEGFDLVDFTGSPLVHYGPHDSDWHFMSSLSAAEMKLFDFESEFTLDNTKPGVLENIYPYPNPCYKTQTYYCNSSDSILLRLVIVDSNLNVFQKNAFKFKKPFHFQINLDENVFPLKSKFRVYYSFSAKGKLNYKIGYGDIIICNEANPFDCFE